MKYYIVCLCLAQIVQIYGAPAEPPSVIEQIASIQQQAAQAVSDLNKKFLEVTGVPNNQELINTIQQQSQTYANQIKGAADQFNQQLAPQREQAQNAASAIAQQIGESATKLLSNQDSVKADQLQKTFENVLDSTKALQTQLSEQGTQFQDAFLATLGKLYEQTIESAKNVASQLDQASATAPKQ